MRIEALAILADRYEEPLVNDEDSIKIRQMRTIEVRTKRGKPVLVLQSKDSQEDIVKTLRENDWTIISWNSNKLHLVSTPILQQMLEQKTRAAELSKSQPLNLFHNKKMLMWVLFLLILLGFLVFKNFS